MEIKRARPDDAQVAFDIRLQAIRHQCIGAHTQEQMRAWQPPLVLSPMARETLE